MLRRISISYENTNQTNRCTVVAWRWRYITCFRFLAGFADAAACASLLSILIFIYPNAVCTVVAWTEMSIGFGAMIGIYRLTPLEKIVKTISIIRIKKLAFTPKIFDL